MSRPNRVLVQNTGTAGPATIYANPAAVPAGQIAAFDQNGTGLDMTAAAPAQYQLVLGHATSPIITNMLTKAKTSTYKLDYVPPVKSSVAITGFPVGPTGGATYGLQVMDLSKGSEPFTRKAFEISVPATQAVVDTIGAFISKMNSATSDNGFFDAKSNLQRTLTLTGTSGTANIIIDGVSYLVTFNTNLNTTAADFVTAHAAAILANHGLTVTNPGAPSADLLFAANGAKGHAGATIANVTGNLAGTSAETVPGTILTVTARLFTGLLAAQKQEHLATIAMTFTNSGADVGSGSSDQIIQLEKNAKGTFGRYFEETGILGSLADPPVNAVAGTNYDMYTILHENSMDLAVNRSFEKQEIILAFATGVAGTLNTFLGVS